MANEIKMRCVVLNTRMSRLNGGIVYAIRYDILCIRDYFKRLFICCQLLMQSVNGVLCRNEFLISCHADDTMLTV